MPRFELMPSVHIWRVSVHSFQRIGAKKDKTQTNKNHCFKQMNNMTKMVFRKIILMRS